MDIRLTKTDLLTQSEWECWHRWVQRADFSSPYFHPQFTRDVSEVRDDVEVAVFSQQGQTVGFLPLQRTGQSARPVGGLLSDAHGIIHDGSLQWDWADVVRQCGLASFDFHYLIGNQTPGAEWKAQTAPAAVINLEGGFDSYPARIQSKSVIRQTERKARKLAREVGEIRFEWNSRDAEAFALLKKWKSQQYHDSDIADVFSFDWTNALLDRIWQHQGSQYEGLLSVMYVGDRPAAVHFGLRAGSVLHQWFPAYDAELRDYSPGVIHLLDMARHANANGVQRIDLGRVCHYKSRVATDLVDVSEGSIDLRIVRRFLRHGYQQTFEWLRRSPLRSVARIPGRMLRRLAEQNQFQ